MNTKTSEINALHRHSILSKKRTKPSFSFRSIMKQLRSTKPYIEYKNWIGIHTLKETIHIINKYNLDATICGGYAIAGLQGKITRKHRDLDIVFLEKEATKVYHAFANEGYKLHKKSFYIMEATKENRLKIDLFNWRPTQNKERVEFNYPFIMCEVPKSFFKKKRVVKLANLEFEILSNEFFKSIIPLATNPDTIDVIKELKTSEDFHQSKKRIQKQLSFNI